SLRDLPLEGFVLALDLLDEVRHLVVRRHRVGSDLAALFRVEAAYEPHLLEKVLGRVSDEVETRVLLADLRCEHGCPRWFACIVHRDTDIREPYLPPNSRKRYCGQTIETALPSSGNTSS